MMPPSPSLPKVALILPVLNAAEILPRCLETFAEQDYPEERVEIIVADGGSKDESVSVAKSYGAKVIPNPHVLAEPGNALAMQQTDADIIFVLAADNGLPRKDWIRLMIQPFLEDPNIIGAFTQILPAEGDNSFTEYYCRLHVEPFTWFVYGAASNPRDFHRHYPVRKTTSNSIVFDYTPLTHPLVALAQGFGVRGSFKRRAGFESDDILPIIQMIEDGNGIAYVPKAGVYHHHLENFSHYLKKYTWRIRNSLYTQSSGFDNRLKYMTPYRKFRKYLFVLYGLSGIFPLLDGIFLVIKEKRICMLWHGPASTGLSAVICFEVLKKGFRDLWSLVRTRRAPVASP